MEYVIILCFDEDTESYFNAFIRSISDSGVSSHMIDERVPPHISLACFQTETINEIINELNSQILSFKSGGIVWSSLGAFIPNALFAAPVMNEYLLNACIDINRLIEPFSTPGQNGWYLPYQWVPHTTLAYQLSNDGLKKAFDIVSQKFTFVSGKGTRLLLAECNPYKEIKAWNLT